MPTMLRMAHLLTVAAVTAAGGVAGVAAADSQCDPVTMAMSPQPVLSCPGLDPVPYPHGAPMPDSVHNVAGPPAPSPGAAPAPVALPPPGQAPYVPPVLNHDGTQSFGGQGGQGGLMGDMFGLVGSAIAETGGG